MKNQLSFYLTVIIGLFILSPMTSFAQRDLKFGGGMAFLGSGDINVVKFETELTQRLNRHFSTSVSLNFGHGVSEGPTAVLPRQVTTTAHIDPNIFFSPFGNTGVFNLKIGTGASLMYVNDAYQRSFSTGSILGDFATYEIESRFSLGVNMIIEPEVRIGKNIVSVKGVIQPYLNGDISSGVNVKFGRLL